MKSKLLILGLITLGISILSSCNDVLTQVGSSIQPDDDVPTAYADTFFMKGKTVLMDSVYARTTYGSIGEIYDPLYGNLKSDFMAQFYCPDDFRFRHTPANGKIDSVEFKIMYNSWIGDSLTPMRVQLYEVTSPLENDFYTDIDPGKYCNLQKKLGSQTYTAHDMSVSDSIRQLSSYTPTVTIRMPKELGERFYNATINDPGVYTSQQTFNQFFPGVYVTNTYGTGNIINVENAGMYIYYKYIVKGSANQDSLVQAAEFFNTTSEVIQLNRFKNTDMSHLLVPSDSISYLKSPAGVYTELTLPTKDLTEKLSTRIISNISLTLRALPQENWQYAFDAPSTLLVLPKDSVNSFFLNNSTENNVTSYLGTYSSSTRTYSFGNIANLLKAHLETNPDNDIQLCVIPVERRTGTTTTYWGTQTTYTIAINNYLKPSGVKLRIDKDAMVMRLVTIEYK